jgi:hypothetical protein
MSAIITDQLRILNAKNFVSEVTASDNSYYAFIGLSNATEYKSDWDVSPPAPKDNFEWETGQIYDMYRHDISSSKVAGVSSATSLYSSNYYVVNEDLRVYICLDNGASPENNFTGNISLDQPTFIDLEPRSAGNSGDGYLWKYLYTIKPSEIIKFDSINFITTPKNWSTNIETQSVRNHAEASGQLKVVNVGSANAVYTNVPIKGDGTGAKATVVIGNQKTVSSITISEGGSGYTFGTVDYQSAGITIGSGGTAPEFDVIIPPKGGHGYDIYRELGASSVLMYTRIENTIENPDFITGNQISRFGIVENPTQYQSDALLNDTTASASYALKLKSPDSESEDFYRTVTFPADTYVTQTVSTGTTAVGRVISYDKNTGVLKYWQDRRLAGFNTDGTKNTSPEYGFELNRFTSTIGNGGSLSIIGSGVELKIDDLFTGVTTQINNNTYQLGQSFNDGVSNPEVEKYSGNIIYVDNRPSITRSSNQKEDIKVILQF